MQNVEAELFDIDQVKDDQRQAEMRIIRTEQLILCLDVMDFVAALSAAKARPAVDFHRVRQTYNTMKKYTLLLFLLITTCASTAQTKKADRHMVYKKIDTTALTLDFYYPAGYDSLKSYPAITFFFGGGWVKGSTKQFEHQALYFASRNMIAVLADYRVYERQGTTPFDALEDAKSAIRFLRQNSERLNIDADRIVACGGSAGGHLAAACAILDGFDDDADNLSVSARPNALVLFNPVIDNGPGGFGYSKIGERYRTFSPLHNLHTDAPPTIIFLGSSDQLIPVETMEYYKTVMEKVGSRCELFIYKDQKHGFFNFKEGGNMYYDMTLSEADKFLVSLGYITPMSNRR